jgi:uncharacterized RDD family membrane protein YckC
MLIFVTGKGNSMTHDNPTAGNEGRSGGHDQPSGDYGSAPSPAGYAQPPGYGQQPGGYGSAPSPAGYAQPPGYGQPVAGHNGPPAGYSNPAWNYSNWGMRLCAWLIDTVPLYILYFIGGLVGALTHSVVLYLLFDLAAVAVVIYNRWYHAGKTGQSWGKKVLHMSLISEQTGQPIGGAMAFVRDICHFLDTLCCFIGFLFPLWDAKRQTFADKIVGTIVIPLS